MKIAYTINGLIGGFVGRNSSTSDKSKDSTIILEYVSNLLNKNVIEPNNADVFVFTWHTDFEDELNKFLKPTSLKLQKQIDFEIFDHLRGPDEKRVNNTLSRWYGFREVINLVRQHEQVNNFKYDLVVNARFDICWNRPIDLGKLDNNKFHIPWHPDIPKYGWPYMHVDSARRIHGTDEILDHIFASNSDSMLSYTTMYENLYDYSLPGNCPAWKTISNHFLMVWHLRNLGMLDGVEKTFGTFDHNNPKLKGGSEEYLEVDYDLFRYREFTKDEVIELNDKVNNI